MPFAIARRCKLTADRSRAGWLLELAELGNFPVEGGEVERHRDREPDQLRLALSRQACSSAASGRFAPR